MLESCEDSRPMISLVLYKHVRRFVRTAWGYFISARPVWFFKTIFAVGWGQYCGNGNHLVSGLKNVAVVLGMVGVWAGLYGLNDVADKYLDSATIHKRFRRLADNKIGSPGLLRVSIVEIGLSLCVLSLTGALILLLGGSANSQPGDVRPSDKSTVSVSSSTRTLCANASLRCVSEIFIPRET